MNIFNNGLLTGMFGSIFQACAVWIIILAFAIGRREDIFESIGVGAVQIAGQAAGIVSNGSALSAVGVGGAILQRRKRSIASTFKLVPTDTLNEIESLFPIHPYHDRVKRAACHGLGTGGGTGSGTGGGTIDDGEDIDVIERRKKAALKRKAAQKRKANSNKKTARKTKNPIVSEDDPEQSLRRRKRQSEVDDLNAGMNKSSKDISEHIKQFSEKIRIAWENFANTWNQLMQQVKQKISGTNDGDQTMQEI